MNMKNRIEIITDKKLVVLSQAMSLVANKTHLLWNSFMKRKTEIENAVGLELYSIQAYGSDYFDGDFVSKEFVKMAGIEVSSFENIPLEMQGYVLEGGKYAVFDYKGNPKDGGKAFEYIFNEWLPQSGFLLDDRVHFEVLGTKYKNDSDESEEEIWIPVK